MSDHVVACPRTLIQLKAVAVALLKLLDKVQRLVVLKINAHRVGVGLDVRLAGRRIMAKDGFRAARVGLVPTSVDVTPESAGDDAVCSSSRSISSSGELGARSISALNSRWNSSSGFDRSGSRPLEFIVNHL